MRLDDLDDTALAEFAADAVRRADLAASVWTQSGQIFVGVEQHHAAYRRALCWVLTGEDRELRASSVDSFADLCERESVADGTIMAACAVSSGARRAADRRGIALLDRDDLQGFLDDPDVHLLLGGEVGPDGAAPRPASSSGEAGANVSVSPQANLDGDGTAEDPVERLRAIGERAGPLAGVALVGVLLVVALVLGASILGLAPGGGSGADAMTITAAPAGDGPADLRVAWNAEVGPVVDLDPDDGLVYRAPDGSRFVVVDLRITNVGSDRVAVEQSDFVLSTNGSRHGHQPLVDAETFVGSGLPSGAAVTGTTVFRVPENATAAELHVSDRLSSAGVVAFERDDSLSLNVSVERPE